MASEVKDRLMRYLKSKRISQIEFTRALNVSSAYVGAMRRSISDEKVKRIRTAFPDLNTEWLLYGEGEMLRDSQVGKSGGKSRLCAGTARDGGMEGHGIKMVPLLPSAAFAGSLQAYSEGVRREDCELVATQLRGAQMAVRVWGDSMEPAFHDGTLLFIRRIDDRCFIPWGNPMVVDTENGVVVKCLYPEGDGCSAVQARSLNPAYPPFRIPSAGIYGLYRILGALTVFDTM